MGKGKLQLLRCQIDEGINAQIQRLVLVDDDKTCMTGVNESENGHIFIILVVEI